MDSIEPTWQGFDDFKEDYDFACTRAAELWTWIYGRIFEGSESWDRMTKNIEIDAWRAIEYYQQVDSTPKIPKKLEITFLCLSQAHLHD